MSGDADAVARLLRGRLENGTVDLPVAGSSMRGVIATGSVVSVVAAARPRRGEIWAFVDDDERIVVHRIREIDGDLVTGRGTGNRVDDDPVHRQRLIGRVVRATGGGRTRRFGASDRWRSHLLLSARKRLRRFRR